jgi:hypothetical protein
MNNLEIIQEAAVGGFHMTENNSPWKADFIHLNCADIMIGYPNSFSHHYAVIDWRFGDAKENTKDRISLHDDFAGAMDFAVDLLRSN